MNWHLELEEKKHNLLGQKTTDGTNSEIMGLEEKMRNNAVIKSDIRSAENSLEHLPQIVISVSLLIHSGHTRIILGDNVYFIAFSAMFSALSLIRGQGGSIILLPFKLANPILKTKYYVSTI